MQQMGKGGEKRIINSSGRPKIVFLHSLITAVVRKIAYQRSQFYSFGLLEVGSNTVHSVGKLTP